MAKNIKNAAANAAKNTPEKKGGKTMLVAAAAILAIAVATFAYFAFFNEPAAPCVKVSELEKVFYRQSPEFPQADWFDGKNRSLQNYTCNAVVIYFWSESCASCLKGLQKMREINGKYAVKGVSVLGVYSPEFQYQESALHAKEQVEKLGVSFPVAFDANHSFAEGIGAVFVPQTLLIDGARWIRFEKPGDAGALSVEEVLRNALKDSGKNVSEIPFEASNETVQKRTNDVMAGYARSPGLGNIINFKRDESFNYTMGSAIRPSLVYLEGTWLSLPEKLAHSENDSAWVVTGFYGSSVYLFAESKKPAAISVTVDRAPIPAEALGKDARLEGNSTIVTVGEKRLYEIAVLPRGVHVASFNVQREGFEFYKLAFG